MRQTILRLFLFLVVILVIFGIYRLLTIKPLESVDFFAGSDGLVIADTGAAEATPPYSLAALETAAQTGIDALYLPLQLTMDGELVVLVQANLAETSDGSGLASDLSLEALQALDAGYTFDPAGDGSFPWRGRGLQISSLRQVLAAFPDLRIVASLQNPTGRSLAALLNAVDAAEARPRVLTVVDDQRLADALRLQAPDLATAYTGQERQAFSTMARLRLTPFYRPAAPALLLDADAVEPHLLLAAHSRGISVVAGPVVGVDAQQLLLDSGVDAVIRQQ